MLKNSLNLLLIICAISYNLTILNASEWIPPNISTFLDQEIQEALLFSASVTAVVEEYIQYKLPLEAKADGDIILKQFKERLTRCESLIQTVANIWEYKQCGSALLRDTMAALAALQQNYRPYTSTTSSATRLTFLW